jgi:hypothetical protein
MAAEDDAAGAADAPPAKQDWGADEDDNALPPLSNMGWADDDEDELPPLDPAWANLPVPDSPKREKPPAAFKPRDDRGGAEPRGSVFSRLGEGGGNAWRRPDAPPDRGGPPDRGPPRSRDPPAGRREDPPRGRREPENPHDWHREQMRLQEAERAARGEPHRSQNAPSRSPNANARPQNANTTQRNAMPAEVVYLSRDAQRAAALKREEDAAWRLARDSLATFHATAAQTASHSAAFAPSACREMLNALSEPPFAEGRLAPNARAAFAVVASASKSGATRPEEEVRAVVTGVVAPLRHLLAHGVATPGGAAAGSTGAFIAEQMHTAAVKLLAAALEVLAGGEVTRGAVEAAEGIKDVREAAAAKIAGGAPRAGQKKAGPGGGAGGGGGAAASSGRGDKGHKGDKGDKGDKGAPLPEKLLSASKLRKPSDGPSPLERDAKGPDRDRWEKKHSSAREPRAEESSASRRVSREGAREPPDRRRSLEEKPRPRSEARDGFSAAAVSAARPRVVPKVVIRPSREKEDPRRDAAPAIKAKSAKSTKEPPAPGSSPGSVFSRLEGTPSPLPAPAGDRDAQTHKSPKPPPGKSPHASAQKLVPSPKPAAGAEKHDIPHPKPAAGSPAAGRPGRGEKKHAAPGPKDASSSKGEKKHGGAPGDEWHALDEELERAAGKAGKGRAKGDKTSGGKEARAGGKAGGAEKHDIPHPKTAAPAAPAIPAPKPSPGTSPAPKPVPPKDELDTVLDEELAKAKKIRRPGGRGRGGK